MLQQHSTTEPTRRAILAGAAIVTLADQPARGLNAIDREIFDLAAQWTAANREFLAAVADHNAPDSAFMNWLAANAPASAGRDNWEFARVDIPMTADFAARREAYRRECGLDAAEERVQETSDRAVDLRDRLTVLQPASWAALARQAQVAEEDGDPDSLQIVVGNTVELARRLGLLPDTAN